MEPNISINLLDLFDLPDSWGPLRGNLRDVAALIDINDLAFLLPSFDIPPNEDEPIEEWRDIDAKEVLEWYEGEEEEEPADEEIPQNVTSLPSREDRTLNSRLNVSIRETVVINLFGGELIALVIDPGIRDVEISQNDEAFEISTTISVWVRLSNELFRPVIRSTEDNSFIPDLEQTHVNLPLGEIPVKISSDELIELNGSFSINIQITNPIRFEPTGAVISAANIFYDFETSCLTAIWTEQNIADLMQSFAGDLFEDLEVVAESEIALQVHFQDTIDQIRLDWDISAQSRLNLTFFELVEFYGPSSGRFSIILTNGNSKLSRLIIALTLGNEKTFNFQTDLGIERNDDGAPPLLDFEVKPKPGAIPEEFTVGIIEFDLDQPVPSFIQQSRSPLSRLMQQGATPPCEPVNQLIPINPSLWEADFDFNLFDHPDAFNLSGMRNVGGSFFEFYKPAGFQDKSIDLSLGTFQIPIGLRFEFSGLEFDTILVPIINWRDFSFDIDFNAELALSSLNFPTWLFTDRNGRQVKIPSPGSIKIDENGNIDFSGFNEIELSDVYFVPTNSFVSQLLVLLKQHENKKCIIIRWSENSPNNLLGSIASGLADSSPALPANNKSEVTAQVLLGDPISEIRIDWEINNVSRTLEIPGLIKLQTPSSALFTLLIGAADRNLSYLSLGLSTGTEAGGADNSLILSSNFTWLRNADNEREQHNNASGEDTQPLFKVIFEPTGNNFSMVVLDLDLAGSSLPSLFKVPEPALLPLNVEAPETLCLPIHGLNSFELPSEDWKVFFEFNAEVIKQSLPFLKDDSSNQFIEVALPDNFPRQQINSSTISIPLKITINLSSDFVIASTVDVKFNWKKMALSIDHEKGIDLCLDERKIGGNLLGLSWTLHAVKDQDNPKKNKLFKLITKNNNYGIQLVEGAYIELAFDKITEKPIIFRTTDFALTPEGISLTTTVIDAPVRLNGIDTKFRFTGSGIKIVRSEIQSFTIAGTGPLPPALVGEATADINLQFGRQSNGNLTLLAGSALLKGDKLLKCQGTRFQFQIDAIGLKFVNDGKFHLYFTLTGLAKFVLTPKEVSEDGPLSLLPNIQMEMVECPLTGDASVIGKHVNFLIEMPKPVSFNFLGAFEMELRAIGFVPQFEQFGGDGAMHITGQVKFAQGLGDTPNAKPDFHKLYIGLPKEGTFIPRIYFKQLPVNINMGAAFRLNGVVEFVNDTDQEGFIGDGEIQIQGLPTLAAAFGFMRVRRNENAPWVRAWFLYAELRKVSFMIPVIQIYIREIGLGFGYRYTLVSIKAADEANDVKKLLAELSKLSRTQGNLAKRDQWALDIEKGGSGARWTIVFRALISQMSAAPSPISYDASAEGVLACLFLFDVVVAFRSDLTFFMAARGWINTNYNDLFVDPSIRSKPFVSGFILLSPRQKRFLAHVASNPEGHLGTHPELPGFMKAALKGSQFSATLLVEPGLLHYELGWPNMLRWKIKIGPLAVENIGGFIFRISTKEFILGINYIARGELDINVGFDAGAFGLSISAYASVGYGARYIGVVGLNDPINDSAYYGAMSTEINVRISIRFWIEAAFVTLKFRFSVAIHFSAALEVGIRLDSLPGVRARGTIALKAMGKRIGFSVKIGVNEGTVDKALERTKDTLDLGLTASDVEDLPGLGGGQNDITSEKGVMRSSDLAFSLSKNVLTLESAQKSLEAPNYTIFAIRDVVDNYCYFVIMPQGDLETEDNGGFLPVPPNEGSDSSEYDFELILPQGESVPVEHFHPKNGTFISINDKPGPYQWKVEWGATYQDGVTVYEDESAENVKEEKSFLLKDFISYAFIKEELSEGKVELWDPDPLPKQETRLKDERVLNPNDNAFESAVIGAVEQFRGSPHFKRDLNFEYDRVLDAAYQKSTTVYETSGSIEEENEVNEDKAARAKANQQAHQIRGMIVHDIISDLREYVSRRSQNNDQMDNETGFVQTSIPFQMGLVFRIPTKNGELPRWIEENIDDDAQVPHIKQRIGSNVDDQIAPIVYGEERTIRTFNVRGTDFFTNPPQFENVRHYTDSHTIAINWDLTWRQAPMESCSQCQSDPEQHLIHYQVRRRDLEGNAPEMIFTFKPADILHLGNESNHGEDLLLYSLKPRFQFIDNFSDETLEEQINLPIDGRSYLYTVTPFDYSGHAGRPLTLIATRYPDSPPLVPVDAEMAVTYRIRENEAQLPNEISAQVPELIFPHQIQLTWTEPKPIENQPVIGVEQYRLVFRHEPTVPIGSYGLDSTTQGPRSKSLPTTNARLQPTDIWLDVKAEGSAASRAAQVPLELLQEKGIFPTGEPASWQPNAWQLFIQTVSTNGVPSALAPVSLLLRIENNQELYDIDLDQIKNEREERRPAQLEWLPQPLRLPALPPEDMQKVTGIAHFPMVANENFGFQGNLANISYRSHPIGIRAVRFRWNQGPSHLPEYPLNLNAGYHIYELNIDAQTTETLNPKPDASGNDPFQNALRYIQEVQMLPADDLVLTPGDTLVSNQWEAWYPSMLKRRQDNKAEPIPAPVVPTSPWYSWRESILQWPVWKPSQNTGNRPKALHPFFNELIEELSQYGKGTVVSVQASPPMQPTTFEGFLKNTAPDADPYGWGILQKLGLSLTFSVRAIDSGELIVGDALLDVLNKALLAIFEESYSELKKFLHIELLFQPSQSVSLQKKEVVENALLGLVQLSLRPIPLQRLRYSKMAISGPSNLQLELHITAEDNITLINQAQRAEGEVDIDPSDDPTVYNLRLPFNGRTNILLRSANGNSDKIEVVCRLTDSLKDEEIVLLGTQTVVVYIPDPSPRLQIKASPIKQLTEKDRKDLKVALPTIKDIFDVDFDEVPVEFEPSDELSTYFLVPEFLTEELVTENNENHSPYKQWQNFKSHLEALNPTGEDAKALLKVPTNEEGIEKILFDFLNWSQRFFDHGPGKIQKTSPDSEDASLEEAFTGLVATAYPRISTPAYASPDEGGRLTYNHLIEDKWGHTYRYYIQPYGRYDLLWKSLRESTVLFPETPAATIAIKESSFKTYKVRKGDNLWKIAAEFLNDGRKWKLIYEANRDAIKNPNQLFAGQELKIPIEKEETVTIEDAPNFKETKIVPYVHLTETHVGGLDVVLDRVNPVAKPLILRSGRLDIDLGPGAPALPGKTWEVIIAQHPEQALAERNQTLARQLSYRQLAFTLLRRFTYDKWYEQLVKWSELTPGTFTPQLEPVENHYPNIPLSYPAIPDHIDLNDVNLSKQELESLNLPLRMDKFQQGALVLQWEALPFFYEHRMLVVAQSDVIVSPVNEVIQRDFEYRSPLPEAVLSGSDLQLNSTGATSQIIRGRKVVISLKRLWESLPPQAQKQWEQENPELLDAATGKLRPGGLPDPDVIYQIIDFIRGNIEVQAELFYEPPEDEDGDGAFVVRQLGKSFKVMLSEDAITIPTRSRENYKLNPRVLQRFEIPLSQAYPISNTINPQHVLFENHVFVVYGVFTAKDKAHFIGPSDGDDAGIITNAADRRAIEQLYEMWICEEIVSREPSDKLDSLPENVMFPNTNECTLVWTGQMTSNQENLISNLPGDAHFQQGLTRLIQMASANEDVDVIKFAILRGPEQAPSTIPTSWQFGAASWQDGISWRGPNEGVLTLASNEDKDRYVTLSWNGILDDSTRMVIEPVWLDWAQIPELADALNRLLSQIDNQQISFEFPYLIDQAGLDALGLSELKLQSSSNHLRWSGDALPTEAQIEALNELDGPPAFGEAITTLLSQLFGEEEAIEIFTTLEEIPDNVPEPYKQYISLDADAESGERLFVWSGPNLTREEEKALNEFIRTVDLPEISRIFRDLTEKMNDRRFVQYNSIRPSKIPNTLSEFLILEENRITWTGWPQSERQLETLEEFSKHKFSPSTQYEISFQDAISQLYEQVQTLEVSVNLDIGIRLSNIQLPDNLASQLLIGRARIQYHGLMTEQEGRMLKETFSLETDKQSIERLYDCSLDKGLGDHQLQIRARRGSATPSSRVQIAKILV